MRRGLARTRARFGRFLGAMLIHFTVSSVLPQLTGSTAGMGITLARAVEAARATGGPPAQDSVAAAARLNAIPSALLPRQPIGGRQLLDILV